MMNEGVSMTHARLNYYPRCPKPDLVVVVVLKPHSDASVTTVVLIDDAVSGFQEQKPNGSAGVWYDVPIAPNTLLNVGEAIEETAGGASMELVLCNKLSFFLIQTYAALPRIREKKEGQASSYCRSKWTRRG
ncbi:protein SRG1-like [Panicum miliaceum]|uniref:Protein SRG1-like n=1 Tax=Panicum miliaceum TaxID=4540 RepID=A0A3L6PWF2_PANMI|nr:protein SRG1-like [Panicum miliaceum]